MCLEIECNVIEFTRWNMLVCPHYTYAINDDDCFGARDVRVTVSTRDRDSIGGINCGIQ